MDTLIRPAVTARDVVETESGARRRPRVIITADTASWIIGQMAVEIMRRFGDQYEFWFFTDKLLKLRPDVVRALLPTVAFAFPLTDLGFKLLRDAVSPARLPCMLWVHHITEWSEDMRQAAANASEVIVCTNAWKTELRTISATPAPITVVPHGVDLQTFRQVPADRARFGMPASKFVIGFVGSKRSHGDGGRKGLDTLASVLRKFRSEGADFHISFLGLGWDQEVRQLQSEGISANYLGYIAKEDLRSFYSAIDVYLMTSRVEGGPCTVLEAMACQTPVVATRVGLVPDTIQDGVNGFSADTDDVAGLVGSLLELASSPQVRSRIGLAARESLAASRSWDIALSSLETPLARMQGLHSLSADEPPQNAMDEKSWCRAVQALDGALAVILNCKRGMIRPARALRMLAACWEGLSLADILRGVRIAGPAMFRLKSPEPRARLGFK